MKSQVKLYYSTNEKPFKLMSSKLFIVEDFENYLATFTPLILNDFQYIKDESMQIQIKIIANESNIDLLKENRWKYCSIQNEDATSPRYYFIKNIEWVSQGACVLSLLLDVLNTFKIGTDYSFNAKTNILREHRDRVKKYNIVSSELFSFTDFDNEYQNNQLYAIKFEWLNSATISYSGVFYALKDLYGGKFEVAKGGIEFDELRLTSTYILGRRLRTLRVVKNNVVLYTMSRLNNAVLSVIPCISFDDIDIGTIDYWCKDLLENYTYYKISITTKSARIIDKVSEDINPVLFKDDSKTIIVNDDNSVGTKWNLVYRNQNDPDPDSLVNPVDCFLVPEYEIAVKYGTSASGRILPTDLEDNIYYYVNEWNFPYDIADFTLDDNSSIKNASGVKGFVFYKKSVSQIGVRRTYYDFMNELSQVTFNAEVLTAHIDFSHESFPYGKNPDTILTYLKEFPYNYYQNVPIDWYTGFTWNWTGGISTATLNSINEWDKTDAKLIKIIKLPYIPDDIPLVSGYLEPAGMYDIVSVNGKQCLKLLDLNYKFLNHIDTIQESPIYTIYNLDLNEDELESKLYSSEFFIKKYVYDSFVLPITMENIDYDKYTAENPNGYLNINFYATSTINSRFAFEIADYTCTRGDSDYYNWLLVSRNNEAVLYNIAYINYIRTGYNYDIKNKNVSTAMSWATFGASALGTIGAVIGAVYSGGIAIPMAVGLATTTAMSLANAINTTNKNERDMAQKLTQLKEQSANAIGSDDYDLMYRYNGNSLLIMEYHASEAVQDLLKKLFFYTGYKTNRYGLPLGKTRENFDYLQCNPVFDYFSRNLTNEIESQLELCYRTGVTFIHKHNNDWDMEQISSNREIALSN